jgi:hypothetical protein
VIIMAPWRQMCEKTAVHPVWAERKHILSSLAE